MIFGLKNKFRLIITLSLILIFGSAAFILISSSNDNLTKQVVSEAKSYASLSNKPIIEAYKLYYDSGYLKFREVLNNTLLLNSSISYILIYDANGYLLVDSRSLPLEKPVVENRQFDQAVVDAVKNARPVFVSGRDNNRINEIIYPYEDGWGNRSHAVKYFLNYEKVLSNAKNIQNRILILAISSLVLSLIFISFLVGKVILSPIETVYKGAQIISGGKLDYEIHVKTHDEVEDLASAVNKMARTLQKDIESLQMLDKLKDEFIAIASHHLRTPITVIKSYLAFLEKGRIGALNTEQLKYVKVITEHTKRLSYLIEDLVNVVHFESGNTALIRGTTDLLSVSNEVFQNYRAEAIKKGVRLSLIKPLMTLPQLKLDKQRISEVLRILIDNAIKFSKPGGFVEIAFEIGGYCLLRGYPIQKAIVLVGEGRNGKSTFLNSIGSLDVPTKGTLELENINISSLNESQLAQIRGKKIAFILPGLSSGPTEVKSGRKAR